MVDNRLPFMHGRGFKVVVFWLVVMLVVVVDQATKAGMREVLEDGSQVLLPGLINLVHVENTGAAFSMGQGAGAFFIVVAVAFIIAAILFVWHTPELPWPLVISVGCVAGGGMGNMVDRIMQGSVTDFISLAFMNFPVFNVADICVSVGIVFTVAGYWLWDARRERDEQEREAHDHVPARPHDGFGHA